MPYVLIGEMEDEHPSALGIYESVDAAKAVVFKLEHGWDDPDVLIPDERDVTWREDGERELVAESLDGSGYHFVISRVDAD